MHCFWPIGEQGNSVSCSCKSVGFPVGGEPFLNWPVKKMPQVHAACSTFGNFNPSVMVAFSLISSLSSAVFTWDAVDNLLLINTVTTTTVANNWNDTCILCRFIRFSFFWFKLNPLFEWIFIFYCTECETTPQRMDGDFWFAAFCGDDNRLNTNSNKRPAVSNSVCLFLFNFFLVRLLFSLSSVR